MKKTILSILAVIFVFLLVPLNVKANSEWQIDKMAVEIKVDEDRTLHIKEIIQAYFNIEKHGIFRTIPIENNLVRQDGSKAIVFGKLTNVKCSEHCELTTSEESADDHLIKIGEESKTYTGSRTYVITYDYKLTDDLLKDEDEFYYNIVGTQWDTSIGEVYFKIIMPKDFDKEKIGFSTGTYGNWGYDEDYLIYTAEDKTIEGFYQKELLTHEGLTIRMTLDDNYFIKEDHTIINIVVIVICLGSIAISYLIWKKQGKDKKIIETVEFNPPKGFNSAEVGYMYYGYARNEGVVSLLIYLANNGYIKINEIEKQSLFSKTHDYELVKVKDYDGTDEIEKDFMHGLFKSKDKVTSSDLQDSFYVTVNKINHKLTSKENREKIFEKTPWLGYIFIILLLLLTGLAISYRAYIITWLSSIAVIGIIFTAIGSPFVAVGLSKNNLDKISRTIFTVIGLIAILVGNLVVIFNSLIYDKTAILIYLFGIISIIIMFILLINLDRRTQYGNEMLGKLRGFRNFLTKAEKEKLEKLVEEDPKYFYNILPFTYALGVSSKWIKKFEDMTFSQPDWYTGHSAFNYYMFGNMMDSTMTSMKSTMTSSPSSSGSGSSGGGFSGGGFSGGGTGGGGGGSW